jgi:large subunit ribosomal protein L23
VGTDFQQRRIKGSQKNYKRAVVGLHEPFHYPDDTTELDSLLSQPAPSHLTHPELPDAELDALKEEVETRRLRAKEGKERREKWLNEVYMVEAQKKGRKRSLMKMAKGWRWRAQTHDNKVSRGPAWICLDVGGFGFGFGFRMQDVRPVILTL